MEDNEETVVYRVKVYTEQTQPLIDYYRAKGVLIDIDGVGAIDEVFGRICDALKK